MFRPSVRVVRIVDTSRVPAHYAVYPIRRRSGDGWSGSSDTWGPYFKGVRPSGRRATPSVSTCSYRTSPENWWAPNYFGRTPVRVCSSCPCPPLGRRSGVDTGAWGWVSSSTTDQKSARNAAATMGWTPGRQSPDRRCCNCSDRGPFRKDHRSAVCRRKGRLANETGWPCLRELEFVEDAGGSPRLGVSYASRPT
jgi:hypothetical protein